MRSERGVCARMRSALAARVALHEGDGRVLQQLIIARARRPRGPREGATTATLSPNIDTEEDAEEVEKERRRMREHH